MQRIKKIVVMFLCIVIGCSFQAKLAKATENIAGYHSLNKDVKSPNITDDKTFSARKSDRYYNSRELGQVTSVKNQENTELCWAFALTSLGETSLIKQGFAKNNIDFSEKHLGYFVYNRQNDVLNNTKGDQTKVARNWKYSGGNAQLAMISLTGWYGLANENIAPFNSSQWKLSAKLGQKDAAILKNGFFLGNNPSTNVIKSYIKKYGSVVMAYHAPTTTNEVLKYYDADRKSYNCTNSEAIANHIVTIVGWNDNYNRKQFGKASIPKKNGVWIVKNSWGKDEGDRGYTYISYEDRSMCEFLSGQFVKASAYKYNYFYDGSTNPEYTELKKGQQISNIYKLKKGTKKKKETIKAINLVTWSPNFKYSIQIYKNPKKGKPTSGTKMLKKAQTGTIKEAGTHTINLKQKIKMVKGDKVAVVVKMLSNGYMGYDRSENYEWVSFVNKVAKGQSYLYSGGKWIDLYSSRATMRIKMYTTR